MLLDERGRFPGWLYARECSYRVNWCGVPGETEAVGVFVINDDEGEGGVNVEVGTA